jgi:hypothetical protein
VLFAASALCAPLKIASQLIAASAILSPLYMRREKPLPTLGVIGDG